MSPLPHPLTEDTLHHALKIVSYVPIALFAEHLRVQKALLTCICSRSLLNLPVTGSVKDLTRLWNLNEFDLFGKFDAKPSSWVSSVRNGNSFPLVNEGFLEVAGLVGSVPVFPETQYARPTTLRVTFVTPKRSSTTLAGSWMYWVRHIVNIFHLVSHLAIAVVLGYFKLWLGTILMGCMFSVDVIQMVLRYFTSAVFARQLGTDGNFIPLRPDAPLDVHIITPSWNASSMDVLIGTSTQLHELSNRPMRLTRPRLVKFTFRVLDTVLVVQAATLAGLTGTGTLQAISSLVWLGCYLLMLATSHFINAQAAGLFLESQPGNVWQVTPLVFSRRTTALAFIRLLPVDQHDGVGVSWMDNFLQPGKRRETWLEGIDKSRLMAAKNAQAQEDAKATETEETTLLVEEIRKMIDHPTFQKALKEFDAIKRTTQTT